ncbi:MAG: L,D-transpeptidase [Hyphomicrobium sp.]|jgi:L,D-peptidoglycan transpeptidase YkuD (ErfK/YbiS/YcfS/YnhG family)
MKSRVRIPQSGPKIVVRSLAPGSTRGVLTYGNLSFPCALGRSGRRAMKREGDGATPIGDFALRQAYFRADRLARPAATGLRLSRVRPDDGWCDGPEDRNYNRPVRHPYPASAERLWRQDGLYDLVVVLGYNDRPRVAGRGSAIFMHVASPEMKPTEGCVALRRPHLLRLLKALRPGAVLKVQA